MLKKLEAKEIAQLLKINMNLPCDVGQYNQRLMSQINDPKVLLIGHVENGEIKSFAHLAHSYDPPLTDCVIMINIWTTNHKQTLELAEKAKEWQRELNVKKGMVFVDDNHPDKYMAAFGLRKIANVYEWSAD